MNEPSNPAPNDEGRPSDQARQESIFHDARDCPPSERRAFVENACGDDHELRDEILGLLDAFGDHGFLEATPPTIGSPTRSTEAATDFGDFPPVDDQLGPYRICELIGEGGQGRVYRAIDDRFDRNVAIKLLPGNRNSSDRIARFRAEHQALARMNHVGIAAIFDAGVTTDGYLYFVMEYVPGVPITEFCVEENADIHRRLELFGQVCRAVQHAHQKGVIHRDLKPPNILVTAVDGEPVAKVIDFGIARALEAYEPDSALTQAGQVLGTPAYMSPEQADGQLDIDTRSDIYSLGILLYELLVGTPPFPPTELAQLGFRRMREVVCDVTPVPPSRRATEIAAHDRTVTTVDARSLRGDLDWIVLKSLEKRRQDRYESVGDLWRDIERHRANEPISAGPPSTWYRLRKFTRKHRGAVAAAGLLILSLTIGLVATLVQYVRAERNLAHTIRETDIRLLPELIREARDLWPPFPETIPGYRDWLDRAHAMVDRYPSHAEHLAVVRADAVRADADEERGVRWLFEDPTRQRQHDDLTQHLRELKRLGEEDGLIAEVSWRLGLARTTVERTVTGDAARRAWQMVHDDIAIRPIYASLELEPRRGLLPLGVNAESGLWEFWHVQTGERPEPNTDPNAVNPWRITPETAIVFVLLPSATYRIGAVDGDDRAKPWERPVTTVELDAFYMAKYEITQGLAHRASNNPSYFPPGSRHSDKRVTLTHPVEDISWRDARRAVRRFDMELPTEAQWEYAARGGEPTIWSSGNDELSLQGVANLADRFCRDNGGTAQMEFFVAIDDGYTVHSPVGTYRANGFGLHDMMGNVEEWCLDGEGLYDEFETGTGEKLGASEFARIYRGGSWNDLPIKLRCSSRDSDPEDYHSMHIGVRPVMTATRSAP